MNAFQVVPIAINAQVRYRGYDFDILAWCGNHILRVKKIHRGIAACVASDTKAIHGIPDRLLWIPVQDLEPLTLSELKQVLQPSSPLESAPQEQQIFTPGPSVSMAVIAQPQSQQVSAPLPPASSRPAPTGFGIPSGAKVQTQASVAIVSQPLATQALATQALATQALATQASQQISLSGSQPAGSQRRVLVNHSEQIQRKLWRFTLKSQGVAVIMADPAQPLMEQIETHQPDLLIQEMNTTQFNPYEFCRECRMLNLKLSIILTHNSDRAIAEGEKRWATSQGAADIIADLKPTVDALIPPVLYVLGRLGLPSPTLDTLKQSLTSTRSPSGGPVTSGIQPILAAESEQPQPRSRNLLSGMFQSLGLGSKQAETTPPQPSESNQEVSHPQEPQSFWHRKLW